MGTKNQGGSPQVSPKVVKYLIRSKFLCIKIAKINRKTTRASSDEEGLFALQRYSVTVRNRVIDGRVLMLYIIYIIIYIIYRYNFEICKWRIRTVTL